ncbi:hypothetical protein HY230_03685 [Candidatus Acetothermia bacterium]|nr:hypothetical protein [Candidatus Acetothermia bacterium]
MRILDRVKLGGLIGALVVLTALGNAGQSSLAQQTTKFRWDLVSIQGSNPPTLEAGGVAFALANDGSTLKLTGSGTFDQANPTVVTGGGDWTSFNPDGNETGKGTYKVTGLVRFQEAPGKIPTGALNDKIGTIADARAGLVALRIAFSDGSEGVLFVNCHLPEGSPTSIGEGITVSKGFVMFNRMPPVPGVDANRTVFHVLR